jgi:hypothetical protein
MAVMSLPFAVWRSPRQPPVKQHPHWPAQWRPLAADIENEYMSPYDTEERELLDTIYLALADRVWPG